MWPAQTLLLLGLLSAEAFASTTKSKVYCSTKKGSKSVSPVPTSSAVLTVPLYGFKITVVTPKTTVTPKATTTTLTSTSTATRTVTLAKDTDTFSTTFFDTATTLTTTTITSSSTSFTTEFTTSTPVTTVASPAGFIPIKSSVPNSMKRRREEDGALVPIKPRRSSQHDEVRRGSKPNNTPKQKCDCSGKCTPALYPQSVKCSGIVEVVGIKTITQTCKKTKTITAQRPTSTTRVTVTETTTSTETPVRASTTLSFTVTGTTTITATSTSMTTVTSTETVSSVAPTATSYAACGADNFISQVDGVPLYGGSIQSGDNVNFVSNVSTKEECCAMCIKSSTCGGILYSASARACTLYVQSEGTCSQNNLAWGIITQAGSAQGYAANGLCGKAFKY